MAAGTIKGITIEIEGKTSGLVKSLGNVNKSLSETQKSLKTVNDALKIDPKNVDTLKTKQELLNQAIKETQEKLELEKKAAADAADALEKGTITKNQYDTLQAEIAKTTGELSKLEKESKDTNAQLKQLGGSHKLASLGTAIDQAAQKLKSLGTKITDVGKTLTMKVTTPLVALGTLSVKTAADFEQSMAQVAAVSGATGDDLAALETKAREMGSTTKFSASEAAEAMNYMAMAGWKTEQMLGGISGIMDLAAASGEDLATTSDIVTDALTAFGLKAEDAGRFADVLAAASSNANTNVSMMGESFKYVAPVAGAMGYSVEDVAVALGLMANSGIKASQAGTALRTILTNMAKPTDTMAAAMEKLGVSLDDGNGNMKSFREIMGDLRSGFSDLKMPIEDFQKRLQVLDEQLDEGSMTEEDYASHLAELTDAAFGAEGAMKANAAASLAGARGMSALLAIVNTSDEDFDKLTAAIDGSNGKASEMAGIMQDTLEGRITQMKSKLQELGIQIGEKLIPIIEKVVGWISDLIDWFSGLDEGTQETIIKIGLLVAALGPVLTVGGKVISLISGVVSGVGGIINAISGAGGLNAVLTSTCAGPLAAVVLSITAIVMWIQNWDDIMEVLEYGWEKVCNAISESIQKVKNIWNDLVNSIENGLEAILGGTTDAIDLATRYKNEVQNQKVAPQIEENRKRWEAKRAQESSTNSNANRAKDQGKSTKTKQAESTANHYIDIYMGSDKTITVVNQANRTNNNKTGGY